MNSFFITKMSLFRFCFGIFVTSRIRSCNFLRPGVGVILLHNSESLDFMSLPKESSTSCK